jgi:hypothetical protein
VISLELRRLKQEAAEPRCPPSERSRAFRDDLKYREGYAAGYQDALQEAIEIAEEEEDA